MKPISILILALTIFCSFTATAQDRPIGYWRSHLPYNTARSVATDGNTLFVATDIGIFSYNLVTKEMNTYSKVNGMSDMQTYYVAHDVLTGTTVLAYQNSNIDLFQNNSFYNIPELKIKTVTGTKTIYHIYCENGFAYLSTGIGVQVINLKKREIKESYAFSQAGQVVPTKGFAALGNFFYVVTTKGLYKANKNSANLQALASWQLIGAGRVINNIATVQNQVFVSSSDSLFVLANDTLRFLYRNPLSINHIDGGSSNLYVSTFNERGGRVLSMDLSYQFVDSFFVGLPQQSLEMSDGSLYLADEYGGLKRIRPGTEIIVPNGPQWYSTFDIYAHDKEVLVAHGAFNDLYQPTSNPYGFSRYRYDNWSNYSGFNNSYAPLLDSMKDYVTIAKNPNDGSFWVGSLWKGLFIVNADGSYKQLYHNPVLENKPNETITVPVNSITADEDGNMWMTQTTCIHELVVYTKDGNWYRYSVNPIGEARNKIAHAAAGLVIDNAGQKWFHSPYEPVVIVYNDNHTIDDLSDDVARAFSTGNNIPGIKVLCMVKDKNGAIWIGTDDGIARINCPEQAINGSCAPDIPIVKYDQFAGKLFQGQQVNTIAVDGANRKWIGTNNGIWLVSADADKIVYRYNTDNSPLPSNVVRKISIDDVTGDVYVGTDNGMVSYRSTATEGGTSNDNVLTFPNPVPSGYKGTIAIKGLVENADVRITDISGQLVYRTKALGGQAVWNGLDYTGRRPASGVYLIFATNKDGSETHVGKMVFMN